MSDLVPYISIDIETSGLDENDCQTLELGAVIDNWIDPIEKLPRIRIVFKHKTVSGDPFALQMNGPLLKLIATSKAGSVLDDGTLICLPEHVVMEFREWLGINAVDQETGFIPAGKNFQGFDRNFLKKLTGWNKVRMKHRCIDPAMLYWIPGEVPPDTKTCYERAGLPGEVSHTAVEDAIGVIKLVRAYQKKFNKIERDYQLLCRYMEAFGLLSTIKGDMIIDPLRPLDMAEEILAYLGPGGGKSNPPTGMGIGFGSGYSVSDGEKTVQLTPEQATSLCAIGIGCGGCDPGPQGVAGQAGNPFDPHGQFKARMQHYAQTTDAKPDEGITDEEIKLSSEDRLCLQQHVGASLVRGGRKVHTESGIDLKPQPTED